MNKKQFACDKKTTPNYVVVDGNGNLSLLQYTWNQDPLDTPIPDNINKLEIKKTIDKK